MQKNLNHLSTYCFNHCVSPITQPEISCLSLFHSFSFCLYFCNDNLAYALPAFRRCIEKSVEAIHGREHRREICETLGFKGITYSILFAYDFAAICSLSIMSSICLLG
jgi:hypothetical protein